MEKENRMRRVCSRALAVMLALLFCIPVLNLQPSAYALSDGMIRVKLTRLGSPSSITMKATCDYYLSSNPSVRVAAGSTMKVSVASGNLSLTVGESTVALGGAAHLMRSKSGNYGVQFIAPSLSNLFCGDLFFYASGSTITTILNIYIENYLYGVVGYEISPSSGIEALKAQAVAARNYALRQKSARVSSSYDVTDSTSDQVFKGYNASSSYANVVKAVDATKGGVLYYGNALAACYYSASNGGQTESTRNVWGGKLAYSVVKDDPYDYESSGTKKTAAIKKNASGLHADLKNALITGMAGQLAAAGCSTAAGDIEINAIESITPCNPKYAEPSRLYKTLTFKLKVTGKTSAGESRTGMVSVDIPTYGAFESWYSLSINSSDNETVWVAETEDTFQVRFMRNGHGVGMSQRGAQVMAKNYDMTVADILQFYYPGTSPKRLSLEDTTQDTAAPEPTPPALEVIATARLNEKANLYASASTEGTVTATLAAGATVDVYAVQNAWAAVGSSGKYGFIQTDVLADFTLKGVSVIWLDTPGYARVIAQSAPLLQLPVETAKALGQLSAGNYVRVHAYSSQWVLVETANGVKGYMTVENLEKVDVSPTATPPDEDEGNAGDVITAPEELYGQLLENATLYATASNSAQPLDVLMKGSYVKLLAYNQLWAYVRTPEGGQGYVRLDMLNPYKGQPPGFEPTPSPGIDGGEVIKVSGVRYAYVNTQQLVLYATYSTQADGLATLSKGDRVQVGAYNQKWACVRIDGRTGFVLKDGLTAQAPATPEIEGGAITKVTGTEYVYVNASTLKMYRTYSSDSQAVQTLAYGDRVQLGAYNQKWACVRANGKTGFVLVSGLTQKKPSATDGNIEGGAVKKVSGVKYGYITANTTPMYQSWSEDARQVATLFKGTRVQIGAYNQKWACVRVEGVTGFVLIQHLTNKQTGNNSDNEQNVVYEECEALTTANVNLRQKASTSSKVLYIVPKGRKVHVYAYNPSFAYVEVNGKRGFLALNYLKRVS